MRDCGEIMLCKTYSCVNGERSTDLFCDNEVSGSSTTNISYGKYGKEFKCTWDCDGQKCRTDFTDIMNVQVGCIIRNWTDTCPRFQKT